MKPFACVWASVTWRDGGVTMTTVINIRYVDGLESAEAGAVWRRSSRQRRQHLCCSWCRGVAETVPDNDSLTVRLRLSMRLTVYQRCTCRWQSQQPRVSQARRRRHDSLTVNSSLQCPWHHLAPTIIIVIITTTSGVDCSGWHTGRVSLPRVTWSTHTISHTHTHTIG